MLKARFKCPKGFAKAILSLVLVNIYFHYALDLWFVRAETEDERASDVDPITQVILLVLF